MKKILTAAIASVFALTLASKDIATPQDWNAFAQSVNAGDWSAWKDAEGVVNIVADIDFPRGAAIIESSTSWKGVLDGHGHTISQKASKLPLIVSIAPEGVVRNLNFAGERRSHTRNGWASVLVVNNSGLVENCHSSVEFIVSQASANAHGLVRTNFGTVRGCTNKGNIRSSAAVQDLWVAGVVTDNQGVMENCANYGNITVSDTDANACIAGVCIFAKGRIDRCINEGSLDITLTPTENRVFYCGGVFGRGECRGKDAHFSNCRNKGSVKVVRNAENKASLLKCGVAGVVATVIDGDAEHHLVVESCFNDGPVSLYENDEHCPLAGCFAVGGIVGRVCPNGGKESYVDVSKDGFFIEIRNCRNAGAIEHGTSLYFPIYFPRSPSGARFSYAGGIAGLVYGSAENHAVIDGCINTGAVRMGSVKASDISGGIAGGIGNTDVSSCMASTVFGPVTGGIAPVETFASIGGLVGLVMKPSVIKDSQAKMTLQTESAKVWSKGFIGAVATGVEAAVEGNCSVKGGPAFGKYLPGTVKGTIKE